MLPVTIENCLIPAPGPYAKKDLEEKPRIHFFQALHPFVQLLLAIGNAFFLPSLFLFNHVFKQFLTPPQAIFNRTLGSPSTVAPAQEKTEEELEAVANQNKPNEKSDEIGALQAQLTQLEHRFVYDHLIVEDMRAFEEFNDTVKQTISELKALKAKEKQGKDVAQVEDLEKRLMSAKKLHEQLNDFCSRRGDAIVSQMQRTVDVLTKMGIDLPIEMNDELLQTWNALEKTLRPHLSLLTSLDVKKRLTASLNKLKRVMEKSKRDNGAKAVSGLSEPLKLRNIGTSCYIDSVLQAIACVDVLRADLSGSPSDDASPKYSADDEKKMAIRRELLRFLKVESAKRDTGVSKIGFVLFLLEGPSMARLRESIFKSGLNQEFRMANLTAQQDASELMLLLTNYFLPSSRCQLQEIASTDSYPGLEFKGPIEDVSMLPVALRDDDSQLKNLVHWVMYKRVQRDDKVDDQRFFDPLNGVVVDPAEGAKSQALPAGKVKKYIRRTNLKVLPSALVLHFTRFKVTTDDPPVTVKDKRPVELPADGIIDLSLYAAPLQGSTDAKYKIKSFIAHEGKGKVAHEGHYVAYVEINGKYYCCDDQEARCFKEISSKDFYGRQDAYLLVLEKVVEEGLDTDASG